MIDIETVGTKVNAAIISIGAVRFTAVRGVFEEFYRNITLKSNKERFIDPNTVEWWMQQSKEAQQALFEQPRHSLHDALIDLAKFVKEDNDNEVWANGVTFDLAILRDAYQQYGMEIPWHYRAEMCLRPIRLLGAKLDYPYFEYVDSAGTTKHNALDDAKVQTEYLIKIFRIMMKKN